MNYALPIKYLLVMAVMLTGSGMWMFVLHTSMSVEGTAAYYAPKSIFGILETVTPHLFGMGTLVFVLTHFFAILKDIDQKRYGIFSIGFFSVMLLANLSGFFITEESVWFVALLKLAATCIFLAYTLVSVWRLLRYV